MALIGDGRLVAGGGEDGTVQRRKAPAGRLLAVPREHKSAIRAVALTADGTMVAGAGFDGTVHVWEAQHDAHLRTPRRDRRYERMDITDLTGVSTAQPGTGRPRCRGARRVGGRTP